MIDMSGSMSFRHWQPLFFYCVPVKRTLTRIFRIYCTATVLLLIERVSYNNIVCIVSHSFPLPLSAKEVPGRARFAKRINLSGTGRLWFGLLDFIFLFRAVSQVSIMFQAAAASPAL